MDFKEWPDLLPLIQSVLNNAASPHRKNIAPITAFLGMEPTPPISTFFRTTTAKPVSVVEAQLERSVNMEALQHFMAELHPLVHNTLQRNRKSSKERASRGKLPNFEKGYFVLVAREDFIAGEKLALRWRGPRRIVQALSDYVYQVEDLRNGTIQDIHGSRLKFYHDASLDTEAVMAHVLCSETYMPVARLLRLVEDKDEVLVHVRWKGLDKSEDTLEPIRQIYRDVPALLMKLLRRKNTPSHLAQKAKQVLGF